MMRGYHIELTSVLETTKINGQEINIRVSKYIAGRVAGCGTLPLGGRAGSLRRANAVATFERREGQVGADHEGR